MANRNRRQEVLADLTAKMIESLESGVAQPDGWTPPWHLASGTTNAATGRRYRGGNALVLSVAVALGGLTPPFATYRQWKALGGQIKKGERGHTILVPKPFTKIVDGEEVQRIYWGAATVFAASQQEGWTPPPAPEVSAGEVPAAALAWVEEFTARFDVRHVDSGEAFYMPASDHIQLPNPSGFYSYADYVATLAHESTHASGHPSRLNRFTTTDVPTRQERAREELVAELGSALVGNEVGIATGLRDSHRDYLASWLQILKDEPEALWQAATAAEAAADWVLGSESSKTDPVSNTAQPVPA